MASFTVLRSKRQHATWRLNMQRAAEMKGVQPSLLGELTHMHHDEAQPRATQTLQTCTAETVSGAYAVPTLRIVILRVACCMLCRRCVLHARLGLCIVEDLEGVISNDKLAKEQKPPVEHKLVLRWNN